MENNNFVILSAVFFYSYICIPLLSAPPPSEGNTVGWGEEEGTKKAREMAQTEICPAWMEAIAYFHLLLHLGYGSVNLRLLSPILIKASPVADNVWELETEVDLVRSETLFRIRNRIHLNQFGLNFTIYKKTLIIVYRRVSYKILLLAMCKEKNHAGYKTGSGSGSKMNLKVGSESEENHFGIPNSASWHTVSARLLWCILPLSFQNPVLSML